MRDVGVVLVGLKPGIIHVPFEICGTTGGF